MNIYDYMEKHYYGEPSNLKVGAPNCIFRAYGKELGDFRNVNVENFFKFVSEKSDEELLKIRNFGKGKLQFLRRTQKDYAANFGLPVSYKTRFNYISDDWVRVKNHCRTTDNKDFTEKEPTEEFKRKLLISEHSPIRLIEIDWSWNDIYSWVATHWSRHKFEKFISTQRDDRKEHDVPRGKMPQDTPVNFDGYANMQNLIDSFRKRLCYQASKETRELAEDFKMALHETKPELADVLVPNCVYRCACPEFKTCGYWKNFVNYVKDRFDDGEAQNVDELVSSAIFDIRTRYELYNELFEYNYECDHLRNWE